MENCRTCGRRFDDVTVVRESYARPTNGCRDCRAMRCRQYRRQTKVSKAKKNARGRMQVKAFQSYFECFVKNRGMTPEEAFVRALWQTDDRHVETAVRRHPELVQQWENKEFESLLEVGRNRSAEVFEMRQRTVHLGVFY